MAYLANTMNYHNYQVGFFLIILILVLGLNFVVFQPYIFTLIFGMTLAVMLHPLYTKLLSRKSFKKKPGLSAFIMVLLVLVIILLPLISIGFVMIKESTDLYGSLMEKNSTSTLIAHIQNLLDKYIPNAHYDVNANLNSYMDGILNYVISNLGSLLSNLIGIIISFILTLFSLYYLLKDGGRLHRALVIFSPLPIKYDNEILNKLTRAVNSVIKGTLLVALIQGILAGIGFFIFGVPNPVLLGAITVIAALIPAIGTGIVVLPAALFLLFTGNLMPGIGLLLWGLFLVGLIDNFLRPKFIEKDIHIHPLLIFLSALGGISVFGAFGFIFGPLLLSLLFALLDIYKEEFHEYIAKNH
jgi:predicted PurR-regulated permease PerM